MLPQLFAARPPFLTPENEIGKLGNQNGSAGGYSSDAAVRIVVLPGTRIVVADGSRGAALGHQSELRPLPCPGTAVGRSQSATTGRGFVDTEQTTREPARLS
jgi:hypothetical protein